MAAAFSLGARRSIAVWGGFPPRLAPTGWARGRRRPASVAVPLSITPSSPLSTFFCNPAARPLHSAADFHQTNINGGLAGGGRAPLSRSAWQHTELSNARAHASPELAGDWTSRHDEQLSSTFTPYPLHLKRQVLLDYRESKTARHSGLSNFQLRHLGAALQNGLSLDVYQALKDFKHTGSLIDPIALLLTFQLWSTESPAPYQHLLEHLERDALLGMMRSIRKIHGNRQDFAQLPLQGIVAALFRCRYYWTTQDEARAVEVAQKTAKASCYEVQETQGSHSPPEALRYVPPLETLTAAQRVLLDLDYIPPKAESPFPLTTIEATSYTTTMGLVCMVDFNLLNAACNAVKSYIDEVTLGGDNLFLFILTKPLPGISIASLAGFVNALSKLRFQDEALFNCLNQQLCDFYANHTVNPEILPHIAANRTPFLILTWSLAISNAFSGWETRIKPFISGLARANQTLIIEASQIAMEGAANGYRAEQALRRLRAYGSAATGAIPPSQRKTVYAMADYKVSRSILKPDVGQMRQIVLSVFGPVSGETPSEIDPSLYAALMDSGSLHKFDTWTSTCQKQLGSLLHKLFVPIEAEANIDNYPGLVVDYAIRHTDRTALRNFLCSRLGRKPTATPLAALEELLDNVEIPFLNPNCAGVALEADGGFHYNTNLAYMRSQSLPGYDLPMLPSEQEAVIPSHCRGKLNYPNGTSAWKETIVMKAQWDIISLDYITFCKWRKQPRPEEPLKRLIPIDWVQWHRTLCQVLRLIQLEAARTFVPAGQQMTSDGQRFHS